MKANEGYVNTFFYLWHVNEKYDLIENLLHGRPYEGPQVLGPAPGGLGGLPPRKEDIRNRITLTQL
jgi:hypothetical protein